MKRVLRVNERVHVFINPEGNDGEGKIDSRIFQKKDGRIQKATKGVKRTKTRTQ